MIGFMPDFYPDELVYSTLARYYQRSGYVAYIHAAKDLYTVPTIRPDMYFINPLQEEAWQRLIAKSSPEGVILNHTMFPAYARFLPAKTRQQALRQMSRMEGKPYAMLKVTHRRQDRVRYLRYCPVCAINDRVQVGETYWHRSAQIQGVDVCPEHHCILCDSGLVVSADTPPMLVTAEETIPQAAGVVKCENPLQIELAGYVLKLFNSEPDVDNPVMVGEFLHSRLHGTKYVSLRGEQRYISLLQQEFEKYYAALPGNTFVQTWQLQKVFTGRRFNFVEVCMLAMFLKIPVYDLSHMTLPASAQQEQFDARVLELRDRGMKYPAITAELGASYDVVKAIGEGRYHRQSGKPRHQPGKDGKQKKDYEALDREQLPKVKALVKRFLSTGYERPRRVTLGAVERALCLPKKQIHNLQRCKAYIENHSESYEQYWAREVVWAARNLIKTGKLNYTYLQNKINLDRTQFIRCIPFIAQYADEDLCRLIREAIIP